MWVDPQQWPERPGEHILLKALTLDADVSNLWVLHVDSDGARRSARIP